MCGNIVLLAFQLVLLLHASVAAEKCHEPVDALILLDASGSVGIANWQKSLQFSKELASRLYDLNPSTRIGIVDFSIVANEAVPLTDDKTVLESGLEELKNQYQNSITRTEKGLEKSRELFEIANRDGARKMLVVVTDGETTPKDGKSGLDLLKDPTASLKSFGVHIIAVGVEEGVNLEELNFMATDPDSENVLLVQNYKDLLALVDRITQAQCPTAKPSPVPTTKLTTPTTPPSTTTPTSITNPTPTSASSPSPSPSPNTPQIKCKVPYHKIGCYKDDMVAPRPLPELLFTDRDSSSNVSSGITLNWNTWATYLPELVCRCAKAAKEKGYSTFSIQYYGECWSGPEAEKTYMRNGEATTCVNNEWKDCTTDVTEVCSGVIETNYVYGIDMQSEPPCNIPFEKLGCYNDKHSPITPRTLRSLLLTDRDPSDAVYSGITIDWDNWDTYLAGLVCRCAAKAAEKKYIFFGIQYYGECWSDPEAGSRYSRDGVTDTCVTYEYKTCPADPKANEMECSGNLNTNYIYGIKTEAPPECTVDYQRVGCYKDNHASARPLPEMILTDRDPSAGQLYGNKTIDWGNWDEYIADLICRCARIAQMKRFPYFGVQYYGECWSGPEGAGTYHIDGESTDCITRAYKPCDPTARDCVGKQNVNFVYRVPF